MKRMLHILVLTVLAISCNREAAVKVSFDSSIGDYTPAVLKILHDHPKGNLVLTFEEGTYNFYPEQAEEMYIAISNNDNGNKKVAFPLVNMCGVTLEGGGAKFVFHGSMIPFAVKDSREVCISGLSVDYDYPFVLEGLVVDNNPDERSFTMRINDDNLYDVHDGELFLKGYDWELPLGDNIVFDPQTRAPYHSAENYERDSAFSPAAEDLGNRLVKLSGVHSRMVPPIGSVYTDKGPSGKNRRYPGIVVQGSEDVDVQGVTIQCSGAMALIAERSKDITCDGYAVRVPEGSGRMIAASADATHFVGCTGEINLLNCTFESMLDDATNIHDTYMKVDSLIADNRFLASFGHSQQEGYDFASAGDRVRFVRRKGLAVVGEGKVTGINHLSENCYDIAVDMDLSQYAGEELAVENIEYTPAVRISNCTVSMNRARSLLLSDDGDVLVDNCDFSSMMAGIRICGDANYWFESGRTSNIVIRGNTFRNLGNGGYNPQAVLQVDPVLVDRTALEDEFFHGNIVFEDNTVYSDESQLIYALSVDSLTIRNNHFETSGLYPPRYPGLSTIDIQRCGTVTITGNELNGWKQEASLSIHDCEGTTVTNDSFLVVDNPNRYFYAD